MHPAEFCLAVHGGDKGKTAERTYEVVAEREQAEVFAWIPRGEAEVVTLQCGSEKVLVKGDVAAKVQRTSVIPQLTECLTNVGKVFFIRKVIFPAAPCLVVATPDMDADFKVLRRCRFFQIFLYFPTDGRLKFK